MKMILKAAAAALLITLAACGGGEDPPSIAQASYSQTAPAGAVTLGAGETTSSKVIASVSHPVGPKLARVSISATSTNVRATGAPTSAGLRWVIRADNNVLAQGTLSQAPASGGVSGTASHELDVSGGDFIEVQVVAFVEGSGAVQWDAAGVTLAVK